MLQWFAKKVFGTKNDRELKRLQPWVAKIGAFESGLKSLNDEALRAKTPEFKQRLANNETLDALLPEAFAVVREAAVRTLGQRPYDVQLIGGAVLHEGKIAEMRTGEGKTLVATLPVYLNALEGEGVHVITVNDYLARRDAEWMGQIYKFLGLSVGVIVHGLNDTERQWAYRADVTYGTNNEFGFDFLRDNMKHDPSEFVQRPLHYSIVDEVDSILIDESRTPLIISGPAEQSTDLYNRIDRIIPSLAASDYTIEEKHKSIMLTEEGVAHVEKLIGLENLYDPNNINLLHHVNQALRANKMYKRDVDYVVKDGQVMIVDEFTGRLMPGRRWSDGLHQAVEAKERVTIENENQTLASITFQNYFRMYNKLAGMTGTAETEAAEFAKIYNLDVMVIPTNVSVARQDFADVVYKTEAEKFKALVEEIRECHEKGQPILVGTISIEKSERIGEMLAHRGIPHHILNAKQHEREAEIVAQAGRKGSVTIATNMAGRGTDIVLGGNPEFMAKGKADADDPSYAEVLRTFRESCDAEKREVVAAGGLHIIGTERHESRRIDNQLRGRSGRQGDPGSTRFYLSLEDDLLRIFGGERISKYMGMLGMEEDEVIEHPWLSRAIANAQKKVEAHNFSIRKNLLEYDDVMNQQRQSIYARRRAILAAEDNRDLLLDMIDERVTSLMEEAIPAKLDPNTFDPKPFEERFREIFNVDFKLRSMAKSDWTIDGIGKRVYEFLAETYEGRMKEAPAEVLARYERFLILNSLDTLWKDHLLQMDHLREGIGLRGYGQKDPLLEYKREGFGLFQKMMVRFTSDVLEKIFRIQVKVERSDHATKMPQMKAIGGSAIGGNPFSADSMRMGHGSVDPFAEGSGDPLSRAPVQQGTVRHDEPKVGRNDPCPCGSGKKFKKCCGM